MKTDRKNLGGAAEFKALKLIEEHGTVTDGYYAYNDGWSDERIAREISCSASVVAHRRKAVFGQIKRGGADGETNSKRIDTLDITVASLARRLETIEKAFTLLTKSGSTGLSYDERMRLANHFNKTQ